MITIIAILLFVFSLTNLGFTLYKEFQAKKITSVSFENDPRVEGKRFGDESYPIRFWAQPNDPTVKKLAEQFKSNNLITTVIKTYNWLEDDYTYENDNMAIMNNGTIVISCGADTWLLPSEVIQMKKQNSGKVRIDCEDSAVIASILEAAGLKAYMNIGIIKITDLVSGQVSNYGHGWPSFIDKKGNEYPLESTLGQPLIELKSGTVFSNGNIKVEYISYVKFNLKEVIQLIKADINSRPDPLPPSKFSELKSIWGIN